MLRRFIYVCLTGWFLLLTDCSQRLAVWIASGTTATHLTFTVGRRHYDNTYMRVIALKVGRRGTHTSGSAHWDTVWSIVAQTPSAIPLIKNVVYGQIPSGMVLRKSPSSIVPDRYYITVDMDGGTAYTEFTVHSDGTVTEEKSP
jgi:hypothetical protein